ncbi:class I SAM-dependent methyltransferase [Paenibacillus fonticola]|uniref:class I SAM-dependent methyltransferase n=1 Tax=Paenibacillus fonticola TaxID=379896 RepID=UPI00035F0A60|nr:class I SAM-dependent methyltransferase [Paenibacillus fonticola]
MIPEGNLLSNVERFTGFANVYDQNRPEAPELVVRILTNYLEKKPALIIDVGCGTGLSTLIWKDHAERIIGVEPNDDMRSQAEEKLRENQDAEHISFVPGYSNQLNAADESVDIITCSQSFHWMEPVSTLQEVHRVLRRGGIFAAYDYDWPPIASWRLERQYLQLIEKADALVEQLVAHEAQAMKRDKSEHLRVLQNSGVFRYTREVVFHNTEPCNAERFVGIALSQGGLQTVFKAGSKELDADIAAFRESAHNYFGDQTLEIMFSCRMRLGIK